MGQPIGSGLRRLPGRPELQVGVEQDGLVHPHPDEPGRIRLLAQGGDKHQVLGRCRTIFPILTILKAIFLTVRT